MAENPLLTQADKDVPPDPSPGINPEHVPSKPNNVADPSDPGGGNNPGDSGSAEGGDGRSLENIKREFDRKFAKLEGMLEGALSRQQVAAPATTPAVPDVTQMTAAQLEALAPQIPEANKQAFNELLAQKRNEEQVKQVVHQELDRSEFSRKRTESNKEAYFLFPELRDQSSRLRNMTNSILNEMGSAADVDPGSLLHAAEVAAHRLGIKRRQESPFRSIPGGGTAPAGPAGGDDPVLDPEKAANIAVRLRDAMPGKKFTKEQLERARKSFGNYNKNKSLFIK